MGIPHGNPMGIPVGIPWVCNIFHRIPTWEFPMGIPWEYPWEFHGFVIYFIGFPHGNSPWESHGNTRGNSHGNPVGMGWELKFLSHGNPDVI